VVGQAEIFAVDLGGGGSAATEEAPGIFDFGSRAVYFKDHGPRDSVYSEIAGDSILVLAFVRDACGLKLDGGKLGGVQEIGTQEIFIPIRFARVDRIDIDLGGDAGGHEIRFIEVGGSGYFSEFAADPGNHEVADLEVRAGMTGINVVRRWGGAHLETP